MTHTYRTATSADTPTLFAINERAVADLARRLGYPWDQGPGDPALWARRRPMFEHLAATADQCWVAEDDGGQIIGYARSILRDGVRELTEFFVLPGRQSSGVGRELLARAFPAGARQRIIVATSDTRALARYLKTGVSARFPIYEFRRAPEAVSVETDLRFEPMGVDGMAAAGAIDAKVLDYRRDDDHAWLAQQRTGFLACRGNQAVGYGYLGDDSGPFAALDPADLPALLAHAEIMAHVRGQAGLSFEVPLINRAAVAHLLARGFHMQPFLAFMMSDGPVDQFENYVLFSPPFFV